MTTIIFGGDEDNYEVQDSNVKDLDRKGTHINQSGNMDIDGSYNHKKTLENKLVKSIAMVVHNLKNLGFTSMTEDAYASAIFLLLKNDNITSKEEIDIILAIEKVEKSEGKHHFRKITLWLKLLT